MRFNKQLELQEKGWSLAGFSKAALVKGYVSDPIVDDFTFEDTYCFLSESLPTNIILEEDDLISLSGSCISLLVSRNTRKRYQWSPGSLFVRDLNEYRNIMKQVLNSLSQAALESFHRVEAGNEFNLFNLKYLNKQYNMKRVFCSSIFDTKSIKSFGDFEENYIKTLDLNSTSIQRRNKNKKIVSKDAWWHVSKNISISMRKNFSKNSRQILFFRGKGKNCKDWHLQFRAKISPETPGNRILPVEGVSELRSKKPTRVLYRFFNSYGKRKGNINKTKLLAKKKHQLKSLLLSRVQDSNSPQYKKFLETFFLLLDSKVSLQKDVLSNKSNVNRNSTEKHSLEFNKLSFYRGRFARKSSRKFKWNKINFFQLKKMKRKFRFINRLFTLPRRSKTRRWWLKTYPRYTPQPSKLVVRDKLRYLWSSFRVFNKSFSDINKVRVYPSLMTRSTLIKVVDEWLGDSNNKLIQSDLARLRLQHLFSFHFSPEQQRKILSRLKGIPVFPRPLNLNLLSEKKSLPLYKQDNLNLISFLQVLGQNRFEFDLGKHKMKLTLNKAKVKKSKRKIYRSEQVRVSRIRSALRSAKVSVLYDFLAKQSIKQSLPKGDISKQFIWAYLMKNFMYSSSFAGQKLVVVRSKHLGRKKDFLFASLEKVSTDLERLLAQFSMSFSLFDFWNIYVLLHRKARSLFQIWNELALSKEGVDAGILKIKKTFKILDLLKSAFLERASFYLNHKVFYGTSPNTFESVFNLKKGYIEYNSGLQSKYEEFQESLLFALLTKQSWDLSLWAESRIDSRLQDSSSMHASILMGYTERILNIIHKEFVTDPTDERQLTAFKKIYRHFRLTTDFALFPGEEDTTEVKGLVLGLEQQIFNSIVSKMDLFRELSPVLSRLFFKTQRFPSYIESMELNRIVGNVDYANLLEANLRRSSLQSYRLK